MNLLNWYEAAIERGDIIDVPRQRELLKSMQHVGDLLTQSQSSWFKRFKKNRIKGLYIYGPVGAGKTYLVDLFFEYLPVKEKARYHFHHFMQQVDNHLRRLQGHKDPLRIIAKEIAQSARVLCFDEFLVHDVAYAMILSELFQALFAENITLVISSNTKPDDLYLNGVQRDRFLPVIDLIKKNSEVFFLNETTDHRLGREPLLEAYLYPLSAANEKKMQEQFLFLAPNTEDIKKNGYITIQNRNIPYIQCDQKSIWFSFDILCNLPRSQLDYLELADTFDSLFISGIPCLTENHTAQVIMFIHCIDVMYDRGIHVIISAEVCAKALYKQGEMAEPFKRTYSRLIEMQSVDYLNRHPRRVVKNIPYLN